MKKGFTLIELLATIVVLGLISLITVPTITKTIENARQQSVLRSAESYIAGVNDYLLSNVSTNAAINNKVSSKTELESAGLKYNGVLPDNNSVVSVSDNKVSHYILYIRGYTVIDGVILTTSSANYNDYLNMANYLIGLEKKLFADKTTGYVNVVDAITGYVSPDSLVYYAKDGVILNYAITKSSSGTILALSDGHIGLNSGQISIYVNTATVLANLYGSEDCTDSSGKACLLDGTHTISISPLSASSTYDVVKGEIIDYTFNFTGYVNNSGQIKTK